MHGTPEELRDHYPGKWLLIEFDGSQAEEGTVLAAHEDPEMVDEELETRSPRRPERSVMPAARRSRDPGEPTRRRSP